MPSSMGGTSGYSTSLPGVYDFTDPGHPGYGLTYLILNGEEGRFSWQDTIQGNTHRVLFCIPWENILSFRQYVLLSTQVVSGVSVRTLPMSSPYSSIFPNTYALSITGRGSGSDVNVSATRLYEDCLCEVEFGTLPYALTGSQAFMEINVSGSADYDTVPDAQLQFATSGEKIDHDAGVLVGQLDITISVHMIPDPDTWMSNLLALKGKVSSADIVIGAVTFAAGHVLFPTFELHSTVDASGNAVAEGAIHLIQRDIPWNSGITSAGVVDSIVVTGTSVHPYSTADLNGVFTA